MMSIIKIPHIFLINWIKFCLSILNIPLKFHLVEDKPFLYVRRQKTNESDTHVKDLLPFGQGVIVVKKEIDENEN